MIVYVVTDPSTGEALTFDSPAAIVEHFDGQASTGELANLRELLEFGADHAPLTLAVGHGKRRVRRSRVRGLGVDVAAYGVPVSTTPGVTIEKLIESRRTAQRALYEQARNLIGADHAVLLERAAEVLADEGRRLGEAADLDACATSPDLVQALRERSKCCADLAHALREHLQIEGEVGA